MDNVNNTNNLPDEKNVNNTNMSKNDNEKRNANDTRTPENMQDERQPKSDDVLDPESSAETENKQPLEIGKNRESQAETEDVLDPEAKKEEEKSNNRKREKKDESESKDDATLENNDTKLNESSDVGSKTNTSGTSSETLGTTGSTPPTSTGVGTGATSGGTSATGSGTVTGGTGAGSAATSSTAAGGAATSGTAAGGAATSGTAAGSTAAGSTVAGSAAASGAAGGATGGAAVAGPILIAILIIIVLIGIISFLFNMPGLMIGKLKEFVQDLWDGFQSGFITEANAFINDDDVLKLAQYLEDMDYSLIGNGFIRPDDEDFKTYLELEEMGYYKDWTGLYYKNSTLPDGNVHYERYDGYYYNVDGDIIDNDTGSVVKKWYRDEYGIRYWAQDGEKDGVNYSKDQIYSLDDVDTALLRTYLMADYRITVLRNDDEGLLESCGEGLIEMFGGSPNAWSKGLIKLYKKDEDGVDDFGEGLLWWNNTDITDSGTKLSIRSEYFNRPVEFELDGWTGRYGLSLEFLLSLHLGTMAPDLVTAMIQCFDTEVQVYCEKVSDSKVLTKYKDYFLEEHEKTLDEHDEEVTIEQINTVLDEAGYWIGVQDGTLIEWVNSLSITKKKALTILRETGLSSPPGCVYTAMAYVVKYMQQCGESEWPGNIAVAATEEDYYLNFFYGVYDSVLDEFDYKEDPLKDWFYNAHNSLYSLRNDKGLGWEGDYEAASAEIQSGVYDVYLDQNGAIEAAKEYQMPSDLSLEPIVEKNFVGTSIDSSKAREEDGYIVVDGYVYRIERELISLDWSLYGYLDDENEFVIGTEEDFNTDRDDLPWEETTAYLNSYIYKIYQSGIEEDGKMFLYGDSIESDRGTRVRNIPIKHVRTHPTDGILESIEDSITVYYDDTISSTEHMKNFRFFNADGDELQLLDSEYYPTSDIVSVRFTKYFKDSNYFSSGIITIMYDAENKSYTFYIGSTSGAHINILIEDKNKEFLLYEDDVYNGEMNSIKDEFLYDVLYLNFVLRDKTIMELVQCGILVEDENGNYVLNEDAGKCSIPVTEGEDIDKCCSVCQRYVKRVIKGLAQVQDTDYAYYQPYIARVVGSWFRDTYFIIPESIDGGLSEYYDENDDVPLGAYGTNGSYIRVDEEYLNSSGEYWTEYEMKKIRVEDDSGNPILDEDGLEQYIETDEYQLYYLKPDGTTSDITLEKWLDEDPIGKTFASKEIAEEAGYVFVKKAKYQSIEDVKENTQKTDDEGGGRDLDEAPYMDGMVWSAYTVGDGGDSGWIKIEKGEVDNIDKALEMVEDKGEFYYKLLSTKSIEQEEDAIRTETNITVKNLFRYRQFYIYDGTDTKAKAIEEDREKILDLILDYWENGSDGYTQEDAVDDLGDYGRYALREAYGWSTFTGLTDDDEVAESWLEYQLDMYYRANNEEAFTDEEKERFKLDELCEFGVNNTYINGEGEEVTYLDSEYYTSDNHSLDPRNRNLISTVNITKSSLDAFSILENVNTLDADYQYRDFKELIVELNYFDKEDLSEAIEEVFTWLIPTYTTRWPILAVDKQDIEYGTLIHSQETIDFLIEVYEMLVEEERLLNENDKEEASDEEEIEIEDKVDMSKVYYIGDSWFVALRDGKITESPEDYFTAVGSRKAGDEEFNNIQVKSDASAIVIMLGLNDPTTQDEMKELLDDLSTRYSDKDIYVLKVFHVGRNYTNRDKDEWNALIDQYNEDISEYCTTKSNLKFVDATTDLIDDNGYLDPSSESSDGMHLVSYSKLYSNIKEIVELGGAKAKTQNEQILEQLQEATAYVDGDSVISPATGKILAYGEHERINVYTQEKETVGYVKIEIMGFGEEKDSSASYFTKDMLSETSLTDEEKKEAVKGLNAFYDEYKDQNAGYTLMIDGIDITDLKNGFANLTDAEGNAVEYDALGQYQSDPVTALYNSKEQKRREEEAEAKQNAPYLITYNANYEEFNGEYNAPDGLGGYYVKEGAYLGKVQEATEITGEKVNLNEGVQKDNPNLDENSDLVKDDPEKTVDIRKAYDKFLEEENPNYVRLIFLDTKSTYVDNVEDYFPGFGESGIAVVDQEYVAQPGDLQILANLLHHEGCGGYFASAVFDGDMEMGNIASRVTGYVCLNRAIINYGGNGTTISEQIAAKGQYSTKDVVLNGTDVTCSICLENAEWCLKYDCSSVTNPEGEPMPREVTGQSGWCQCNGTKNNCWWWIDTTGDGKRTEYTEEGKGFDTFYCK